MPIYDFKCRECGKVSEILLRNNNETVRCLNCGSSDLEKLVSASCVIKNYSSTYGATCCGRAERCEAPPCSTGNRCRRD